jgi:glycosyltransferase involved in cell wall biosynthesis
VSGPAGNRPLHVAVDANVLEATWGGIPKHVHRITAELAAGGDRVDLLINLRRWRSPVPGAQAVPLRLRGRPLWREIAVPLWARRHRPDVLWAPETILPRRAGVPTVATVHDVAPVLFPGSKPAAVERAFRTAVPRSLRRATLVVCASAATVGDVERLWGIDPARMRVVGNGVDERFAPGDRAHAQATVQARFGLAAPFVLHVGSLEPRKGLEVLIAAARQADWRLVLAGSPGYDGARILAAARAVGAAHLEGVEDELLVDLYRAADVVAAPALYEGYGIVGLEAMACGAPVVAAAPAGALEEVLGDAALLVRERRPDAWAAAIAEACARRDQLAARGVRRAATHRWPAVAAAMREVLAEAAEGA